MIDEEAVEALTTFIFSVVDFEIPPFPSAVVLTMWPKAQNVYFKAHFPKTPILSCLNGAVQTARSSSAAALGRYFYN